MVQCGGGFLLLCELVLKGDGNKATAEDRLVRGDGGRVTVELDKKGIAGLGHGFRGAGQMRWM